MEQPSTFQRRQRKEGSLTAPPLPRAVLPRTSAHFSPFPFCTSSILAHGLILPQSALFLSPISLHFYAYPSQDTKFITKATHNYLLGLRLRSPFGFGYLGFVVYWVFCAFPPILADLRGTLAFLLSSVSAGCSHFKSRRKRRRFFLRSRKMLWVVRFSGFFSAAMVMIVLSPSLQSYPLAEAIRSSDVDSYPRLPKPSQPTDKFAFRRAPSLRNADECRSSEVEKFGVCDPSLVHVATTLDVEYLRGSIAAVHSILQHSK